MDNYNVKGILKENQEGYTIRFDDPNLITVHDKLLDDVIQKAQEVIGLEYVTREQENSLDEFSHDINIDLDKDEKVIYINVWLPYYRSQIKEVYKNKTLTIPVWLDHLATKKNLNFSHILVKALKEELGIK